MSKEPTDCICHPSLTNTALLVRGFSAKLGFFANFLNTYIGGRYAGGSDRLGGEGWGGVGALRAPFNVFKEPKKGAKTYKLTRRFEVQTQGSVR